MHFTPYFLIKLSVISVVGGIINNENKNKNDSDIEGKFNQKLHNMETNLLNRFIAYVDSKVSFLNNNMEEKITQTLDALKTSNKNLEDRITQRLNASLDASIKKLEERMAQNYDASLNVSKNLEERMTQKMDSMKKELHKNITNNLTCEEQLLSSCGRYSPSYEIRSDALNHAALQRNSTGHLTHFESHITIKADRHVRIWLMNKGNHSEANIKYYLWIGDGNQYTDFDKDINGYTSIKHIHTPDILSATDFRTFFLQIGNGKLEFSKEGASPLISYDDTHLGSVNYFQFNYGGDTDAKILYDCPAPVIFNRNNIND